jgi:class 3 adenylate cyclase
MQTCPSCGHENPDGARFCNECAAPLPASAPALAEERKIVTVLFVDLVGFTARSERLDPEDVRAIQAPYFARVRAAIESFGGTVEKFIGDAVMAVFGAPVAHGDDPERAVRAALAILEGMDLDVRIAVNTGEALVSVAAKLAQGEGIVSGDVVNTAARLQSAAPVNGILVGAETYHATRAAIAYEEVERVLAKGKEEPVPVWRALGPRADLGAGAPAGAPMLGRTSELETLLGIWERVVADRRPQLVTLFGPAGIGKSRLSSEFTNAVQQRDGRVVWGRSLPYGEMTPYGSFAAQIKQMVGIFDIDETDVACAKLERAVEAALRAGEGDAREVAAHLAMLIGVGREGTAEDRQTLFYSARRYVEALAVEQPTLLVFEDIHLAASSMLDLLEMLASRVRDVPLLLLTQARPELLSERPAWGGGLPAYAAVQLEPLADEHTFELAQRLFESAGAPAQRISELAETAEGNPLFVEELVASLAEGRAESGHLPTSIRNIVAARIDALPGPERDALLDASVAGKVFWPGSIGTATAETLDALEGRDLIRRDPVSRLGAQHPQFTFKHQLIREVAYATLPRARRRERHEAIAVFLEEAVAETGDVAPALANHWHEAGDLERASGYYVAAGDQANRGWAKEQAAQYYQQALSVIPEGDRELRREVAKRYAVAAQASLHLPEMLAGRGGPRSAENRPE